MKQLGHHSVTGLLDKYLGCVQSVGSAACTGSTGGGGSQASEEKEQRTVASGSTSGLVPALWPTKASERPPWSACLLSIMGGGEVQSRRGTLHTSQEVPPGACTGVKHVSGHKNAHRDAPISLIRQWDCPTVPQGG